MAHVKDDFDTSVGRDSVFDWGISRDGSATSASSLKEDAPGNDGPSSRYDPKAMSRIVDINDLVDESGDDSDDEDDIVGSGRGSITGGRRNSGASRSGSMMNNSSNNNNNNNQPSKNKNNKQHPQYQSSLMCRQVVILVSLVMIIAAASLAVGYAIMNAGDPTKSSSNSSPTVRGADNAQHEQSQQSLLEIAERVITACSESSLDADMSACQKLCHASMCCFEDDEYSCAEDVSKDCAVYAGCEALVEGVLMDGAEEDED